jgi:beta-xylosidase
MKKILKSCLSFILMVIVSMQLACAQKSQSSIQENNFDDGLNFIESTVDRLRDPCVLVVGNTYYMYGTGWVCYKNTSKDLTGEWDYLGVVAQVPNEAVDNYWAPEVHKINGKYYMFTTYMSSKTNLRGCTVMCADSPEGPFVEISKGQITAPLGYHCIDGTLHIDDEGQPWLVFVREWIGANDKVGAMMVAKLSDDFSKLKTQPKEIFRANEPSWAVDNITDGCWVYKCKNGELLMLWSNFDMYGYCVAIARSSNGKIDGEWTHDKQLLYSGKNWEYDGGHGMIFTALDGTKYLSIHSPNNAGALRSEKPVFIRIKEENGTLKLVE